MPGKLNKKTSNTFTEKMHKFIRPHESLEKRKKYTVENLINDIANGVSIFCLERNYHVLLGLQKTRKHIKSELGDSGIKSIWNQAINKPIQINSDILKQIPLTPKEFQSMMKKFDSSMATSENENDILADIIFEQAPLWLMENIGALKLSCEKLFDLAKKLAKLPLRDINGPAKNNTTSQIAFLNNLHKYKLSDPHLLEIANIIADRNINNLIEHIEKFNLSTEQKLSIIEKGAQRIDLTDESFKKIIPIINDLEKKDKISFCEKMISPQFIEKFLVNIDSFNFDENDLKSFALKIFNEEKNPIEKGKNKDASRWLFKLFELIILSASNEDKLKYIKYVLHIDFAFFFHEILWASWEFNQIKDMTLDYITDEKQFDLETAFKNISPDKKIKLLSRVFEKHDIYRVKLASIFITDFSSHDDLKQLLDKDILLKIINEDLLEKEIQNIYPYYLIKNLKNLFKEKSLSPDIIKNTLQNVINKNPILCLYRDMPLPQVSEEELFELILKEFAVKKPHELMIHLDRFNLKDEQLEIIADYFLQNDYNLLLSRFNVFNLSKEKKYSIYLYILKDNPTIISEVLTNNGNIFELSEEVLFQHAKKLVEKKDSYAPEIIKLLIINKYPQKKLLDLCKEYPETLIETIDDFTDIDQDELFKLALQLTNKSPLLIKNNSYSLCECKLLSKPQQSQIEKIMYNYCLKNQFFSDILVSFKKYICNLSNQEKNKFISTIFESETTELSDIFYGNSFNDLYQIFFTSDNQKKDFFDKLIKKYPEFYFKQKKLFAPFLSYEEEMELAKKALQKNFLNFKVLKSAIQDGKSLCHLGLDLKSIISSLMFTSSLPNLDYINSSEFGTELMEEIIMFNDINIIASFIMNKNTSLDSYSKLFLSYDQENKLDDLISYDVDAELKKALSSYMLAQKLVDENPFKLLRNLPKFNLSKEQLKKLTKNFLDKDKLMYILPYLKKLEFSYQDADKILSYFQKINNKKIFDECLNILLSKVEGLETLDLFSKYELPNNATKSEIAKLYKDYEAKLKLLFQSAKMDQNVASSFLYIKSAEYNSIEDFKAFLDKTLLTAGLEIIEKRMSKKQIKSLMESCKQKIKKHSWIGDFIEQFKTFNDIFKRQMKDFRNDRALKKYLLLLNKKFRNNKKQIRFFIIQSILDKNSYKQSSSFRKKISYISCLLALDLQDTFLQENNNMITLSELETFFGNKFCNLFDLEDTEENKKNIRINIFEKCQNPSHILVYYNKLKETEAFDFYKKWVRSIIKNSYTEEIRNSSPHFKHILENETDMYTQFLLKCQIENWLKLSYKKRLNPADYKKDDNTNSKDQFKSFLKQRLLDMNHVENLEKNMPILHCYLTANALPNDDISPNLETLIVKAAHEYPSKTAEYLQKALALLNSNKESKFSQLLIDLKEFQNVIQAQNRKFSSQLYFEALSYPSSYLKMGIETGGCQTIEGDPLLNMHLLGYSDGKNYIFAITDGTNMIARSISRLLHDKKGGKLVLFLEQMYSLNKNKMFNEMIIKEAKKIAQNIGVELTISEKFEYKAEIQSKKLLDSYGNIAPLEYCDAAIYNNITNNGVFQVRGLAI